MSGSSFSNQEEKIHWIYLKKNQKDISSATKKKKKLFLVSITSYRNLLLYQVCTRDTLHIFFLFKTLI